MVRWNEIDKNTNLVVYLHAPLHVLQHRLLRRGATSGRSDENLESIKKMFCDIQEGVISGCRVLQTDF